jgi:hypothetical protein
MILTQDKIERTLAEYLSRNEAALRAQWIAEDMRRIGFELTLSTENPPGMWVQLGVIRQTEYALPASGFDINSARDEKAMSGSFVTCGNLLRLSQCVTIARQWLPAIWPDDFAKNLSGTEHLDTLNEIWWLKFWRSLQRVERSPKAKPSDPDSDWLLHIHDGLTPCRVNLEVKRRTGNLNSNFKRGRPHVSTDGIKHKFGPVAADTANVAAVTVFVPLADDVWRGVIDWFQAQPHIHGLLIWIECNLGTAPLLKLFKPEKKWVEFLLRDAEAEDFKVAGRTAGTFCKTSEVPEFIRRLVEGENRRIIYTP